MYWITITVVIDCSRNVFSHSQSMFMIRVELHLLHYLSIQICYDLIYREIDGDRGVGRTTVPCLFNHPHHVPNGACNLPAGSLSEIEN